MDFALRKSNFLFILMFTWKLAELHRSPRNMQKKTLNFLYIHVNISTSKKFDFLSAKSTNFRPLFFTVKRNKIHSIIFSARAFSNDSRFQFFVVFIIIRDAQISEVKSLFRCLIETKKNSTRSPKRLKSDEKTQKIASLVERENQHVLP